MLGQQVEAKTDDPGYVGRQTANANISVKDGLKASPRTAAYVYIYYVKSLPDHRDLCLHLLLGRKADQGRRKVESRCSGRR